MNRLTSPILISNWGRVTQITCATLVLSALAAQNMPAVRGQETAPAIPTLEEELKEEDPAVLAKAAREKGEPVRGAIIFHQQHLTCTKCHSLDEETLPLGPNLTKPEKKPTDVFLIDSILHPSKEIREGYDLIVVNTDAGKTVTGLLAEDRPDKLILRDPAKDAELITIPKDEIDDRAESTQSTMPELLNRLANRRQFLDLARYVMEINEGGPQRARELEPDPSLYAPPPLPEYEKHIDHAEMIKGLNQESFNRGKEIYSRLCVNCHGTKDEPGSLPTAVRFASDALRNGNDPHSMYKTLTHGFGLMVPQTWMVPQQKYDAVHYIRREYLKKHNSKQYFKPDGEYLAGLPKGDSRGPAPSKLDPWVATDYGPNLAALHDKGKALYAACISCHQADGRGHMALKAPSIGELQSGYINTQLRHFRTGIRGADPKDIEGMIMAPMSKMLVTDEDVAAVAVYVSSLKPKTIEHSITEGDRQKGQQLYKACCIACHGDKAQGKKDVKAPRLTGRNDWYMRTQIRKFKTNIRGSHPEDFSGVTMRPMARTLKTDGAIHDVIAYIKTLAE